MATGLPVGNTDGPCLAVHLSEAGVALLWTGVALPKTIAETWRSDHSERSTRNRLRVVCLAANGDGKRSCRVFRLLSLDAVVVRAKIPTRA
jgi:hypothetical protein